MARKGKRREARTLSGEVDRIKRQNLQDCKKINLGFMNFFEKMFMIVAMAICFPPASRLQPGALYMMYSLHQKNKVYMMYTSVAKKMKCT
jgi:hypothetical protein